MKSKLFSGSAVTNEFAKDLETVASLDTAGRSMDVLVKAISQWVMASEPKDESEALETLRQEWPLAPRQMEAVLGVGAFFMRELDEKDSIDDIMADLASLDVVAPDRLDNLRSFVNSMLAECEAGFGATRLAARTQQSGLRTVKGITCLVDLRPVITNSFESGDDVRDYKPIVESLVPVIILRIRLSDREQCVFQMDERTVQTLQDVLVSTQKELAAAAEFVGSERIRLSDWKRERI